MAKQVKTMQVKSDVSLATTTTELEDTVTFDTSALPNGITYKGLKAVLSFANPINWNKNSTYDALTVVWDEATMASYASKRPVPAGIELDNDIYWLRLADGDAQIEIYRQEVQQLDGRVTVLETEEAKYGDAVYHDVDETPTSGSQNLVTSGGVKTAIDEATKKPIMVVIGDSYSASDYSQGTLWYNYVADRLNMTPKSYAVSSAGLLVANNTLLSQCQKANDDSSFSNDDVEYIFIYEGCNDCRPSMYNINNLRTEQSNVLNYLTSKFPNSNIIIACNTWPNAIYDGTNYDFTLAQQNMNSWISQSNIYTVTAYDSMNYLRTFQENAIFNDAHHPSALGENVIASMFMGIINGGVTAFNGYNETDMSYVIADNNSVTGDIKLYKRNNLLSLIFTNVTYTGQQTIMMNMILPRFQVLLTNTAGTIVGYGLSVGSNAIILYATNGTCTNGHGSVIIPIG